MQRTAAANAARRPDDIMQRDLRRSAGSRTLTVLFWVNDFVRSTLTVRENGQDCGPGRRYPVTAGQVTRYDCGKRRATPPGHPPSVMARRAHPGAARKGVINAWGSPTATLISPHHGGWASAAADCRGRVGAGSATATGAPDDATPAAVLAQNPTLRLYCTSHPSMALERPTSDNVKDSATAMAPVWTAHPSVMASPRARHRGIGCTAEVSDPAWCPVGSSPRRRR
jgi:hypothetical protein